MTKRTTNTRARYRYQVLLCVLYQVLCVPCRTARHDVGGNRVRLVVEAFYDRPSHPNFSEAPHLLKELYYYTSHKN